MPLFIPLTISFISNSSRSARGRRAIVDWSDTYLACLSVCSGQFPRSRPLARRTDQTLNIIASRVFYTGTVDPLSASCNAPSAVVRYFTRETSIESEFAVFGESNKIQSFPNCKSIVLLNVKVISVIYFLFPD